MSGEMWLACCWLSPSQRKKLALVRFGVGFVGLCHKLLEGPALVGLVVELQSVTFCS